MSEKYIWRNVTIIYEDKSGQITQRRIRVQSIVNGRVRAFDRDKQAPRVFYVDRILAALPEARRA